MDTEETKRFIALHQRGVSGKGVDLAKAEDLGRLARHIEDTLLSLTQELQRGEIPARPVVDSANDSACTYCDYGHVCHFSPGERGDTERVLTPLEPQAVWNLLREKEGGEIDG